MPVPLMGESVNKEVSEQSGQEARMMRGKMKVKILLGILTVVKKSSDMEVCIIERIFWQWWGRGEAVKLKHVHETWNML